MDKLKDLIIKTINALQAQMEAHDGFVELEEIDKDRAVIYCGGKCTDCDTKCIEEALNQKFPDMNFIFR